MSEFDLQESEEWFLVWSQVLGDLAPRLMELEKKLSPKLMEPVFNAVFVGVYLNYQPFGSFLSQFKANVEKVKGLLQMVETGKHTAVSGERKSNMTVADFWTKLTVGGMAGWVVGILLILLSLIQISPIKLNPWDRIFEWLGKKLNGEALKRLQKQVTDLWINNHRQSILTFARDCRANIGHDSEEWANILNLCEEYERYTEKNDVTNGVVRENTKYIRDLYQEIARDHRL